MDLFWNHRWIGSGNLLNTMVRVQGIQVVDADIVAREVVEKGQPTLQKIQQTLETGYFSPMVI